MMTVKVSEYLPHWLSCHECGYDDFYIDMLFCDNDDVVFCYCDKCGQRYQLTIKLQECEDV